MPILKAPVPLDITVRFVETDEMAVVHHSNYIIWFEAGRVAWMDAAGMPYRQVAAGGNHFAVTGIQVEYRDAARFGDMIRVVTWVSELRSRKVSFGYEVRNMDDGRVLASGASQHICVDLEGKMTKIPTPVMDRLQAGNQRLAEAEAT